MQILRKYFPEILSDNDAQFFKKFEEMIESVDDLSAVQIIKNSNSYHFRIAPSHPKYRNLIFEEVLNFHNLFGIRLNISKSIKTTGTISFEITL